jgi:hypothetical protein
VELESRFLPSPSPFDSAGKAAVCSRFSSRSPRRASERLTWKRIGAARRHPSSRDAAPSAGGVEFGSALGQILGFEWPGWRPLWPRLVDLVGRPRCCKTRCTIAASIRAAGSRGTHARRSAEARRRPAATRHVHERSRDAPTMPCRMPDVGSCGSYAPDGCATRDASDDGHLRERLQLIFGDAAHLRLTPNGPRGAVVEIDMPAQT